MSFILPPNITLKSAFNDEYSTYSDVDNQTKGYLRFSGKNVFSKLAKFEVVTANTGTPGQVHIRCSHNKKFLRKLCEDQGWIAPLADEPEEDPSKWSCTLFKPQLVDGGGDRFQLLHVNVGQCLLLRDRLSDGAAYHFECVHTASIQDGIDSRRYIFTAIDLDSLVILPKYVAFKGPNGKYLRVIGLNNEPHLAFQFTDGGHPGAWFEVFTDGHGRAQIMSGWSKKFWRFENANSSIWCNATSATDVTAETNFWPVKVNSNTIALRSFGNNNFCTQVAVNGTADCLQASFSSIGADSRLVVEELVLSRRIYNADFDLTNAIIYGETPVTMATANASNDTEAENTVEFKFTYKDSKSSTWSTSHSWKVGMSVEANFQIPFISGSKVIAKAEYSGSYQWGETITTEKTLETTYSVVVPPNTSISVSLMATEGSCDVPYSYYQKDVLYNGKTVVYKKDDGLYSGINSYNFRHKTTPLTQARSEIDLTREQMLPNLSTDQFDHRTRGTAAISIVRGEHARNTGSLIPPPP